MDTFKSRMQTAERNIRELEKYVRKLPKCNTAYKEMGNVTG